ncbi:phosphotransferase family protein [Streptomyces sp. PT12]|uniref:phosphotransferase family protein n=1 Tax=Streptomyces sp. PT12 TaxID=1510197 RepID=UPI00215D3ACE|nr:aminoglycoside phosphotransferase family protein [Streptomyces sp. PT12]
MSWARARAWAERAAHPAARVVGSERLHGGWTSVMRRLRLEGPPDAPGHAVLRTFVAPFFVTHAEGLLNREADTLRLLATVDDIPAPVLLGVDPVAAECEHLSLLMSLLPGAVRLDDAHHEARSDPLARQLLAIHRVNAPPSARPRVYQAWTSPERVRVPEATTRPEVWRRAIEVIANGPPRYEGCFLHRDFHPGNVLFEGEGARPRVTGVVDWVETSWGPPDLDVAHCATALALLHGPRAATRLTERYRALGGTLAPPAAHRYWRLLDALAYAPDAELVATSWRALGRADLTPGRVARRLEGYVAGLLGDAVLGRGG